MSIEYDGELLKNKKRKGEMLKDLPEGELLKDKKKEGQPLWRNNGSINESDYQKKKLNE